MEEKTQQNEAVLLSGLWKRTSKAGKDYLSGSLGAGNLLVFKNRNKSSSRDPDYYLFVGQKTRRKKDDPEEPPNPKRDPYQPEKYGGPKRA